MALEANLAVADYVVIVIHFLVVLALGIWSAWRSNRSTTSGYFLAGRDMAWWLVGLSLYVSNIGSGSFIGLGGTAAVSGYAVVSYEFHGLFSLLILGFIFTPIYISSGVTTVPEYLQVRFGGQRLRLFLAIVSIIFIVLTNLSAEMYAGTVIIQQTLGWNLYLAIVLILVMTAVYTVAGGLTAVIYTDALQSMIMVIGGIILFIIAIIEVGGFEGLRLAYMTAIPESTQLNPNTTCGIPSETAWHIFRPADDGDLPWPGVVFGIFLLSIHYFCTNQVLVQRSLSAKNLTHTKAGAILAAYLKVLPMILMIYPGMISRALFPNEVACQNATACVEVCENPNGCSNIAYPLLVLELMPTGLKGMMLAAMLAALMSSLTSIFNSLSTLFTIDIWAKIRPFSTELELLVVGRLCTLVLAAVSVLWLPLIEAFGSGELFVYIQSMTSYLSPPIFAIYSAGIFWTRTNEQGAFWGLVFGEVTGLTRMVLDYIYSGPACGSPDTRPPMIKNFHYLHFAIFLYFATVLCVVVVSLLTKPIPPSKLVRLTYWTRYSKVPRVPMSLEEKEKEEKQQILKKEKELRDYNKRESNPSVVRRAWNLVCGITDAPPEAQLTAEEEEERMMRLTSLDEPPFWSRVVLVNLFICMGFGAVVVALFA
ncbi:sodium/glucose cotransporter 4-like [Diadema antillarum]|uniref:sodium/glucose cotransporter 4-like n=1 Tax=Diadema antillarum TaxID=105358 RepID=UPI003A8A4B9B